MILFASDFYNRLSGVDVGLGNGLFLESGTPIKWRATAATTIP
jgi:hypothetical protein